MFCQNLQLRDGFMSESTVYSKVQTPVTLKNRKARLLCQKHQKGPAQFWKTFFGDR